MKKFFALLLAAAMLFSLAACGKDDVQNAPETPAPTTTGQILLQDFKDQLAANPAAAPQEIADKLMTNEIIQFAPMVMPIEPGFLIGFDETEITGFESGVVFAPMIGSIPFVGYIFDLGADADAAAFTQTLKDNANPRWNICTEADETVVDNVGNIVFFIMCPADMTSDAPAEGEALEGEIIG